VLRWFGSKRWLSIYTGAAISVEHSRDSDGDDWYRLVLRGSAGAKTLASTLRDSYPLEQVGRWIASRLGTELRVGEGGPREIRVLFQTRRTIRLGGR
jgi:hypothetical protein